MNVLELIEDGHWEKSVGTGKNKELVCRKDGDGWPCTLIVAARQQSKATRGTTTTGSKKT